MNAVYRCLLCCGILLLGHAGFAQEDTAKTLESVSEQKEKNQKETNTESNDTTEKTDTIEFSVTDANLTDVLRALASFAGTTMVIHPAVKGTVSLELHDISWRKALDLVADMHDLHVEDVGDEEGDILMIKPKSLVKTEKPEEPADTDKEEQEIGDEDKEETPEATEGETDVDAEFVTEASGSTAMPTGIEVEFYSDKELKELDDQSVFRIVTHMPELNARIKQQREEGIQPNVEALRQVLINRPSAKYVKRVFVNQNKATDVVRALLRSANMDYSFAAALKQSTKPQAEEEGKGGESSPEGTVTAVPVADVSLQLRKMPLTAVVKTICKQGRLSYEYENGVWRISPLTSTEPPLLLTTFEIEYIELNKELVKLLSKFITRGSIQPGKNKTLVAQLTEDDAETINEILAAIDIPTKQVLIEARFFELTDDFAQKIGVDWQDLGTPGGANFSFAPNQQIVDYYNGFKAVDTDFYENSVELQEQYRDDRMSAYEEGKGLNIDDVQPTVNPQATAPPKSLFESALDARKAILTYPQFSVILHALKDSANAKQLSNPKIVVSSDEEATIHIGKQDPIIKGKTESTETGTITTFQLDNNFSAEGMTGYLDLGTQLTVMPSVKTENEVFVKVKPKLTSIVGQKAAGATTYPVLFTTRVDTQFTVKSGQTIAIGGLVKENEQMVNRSVPVLGKLPIIGKAFRYDEKQESKSETVVFLTVKVMEAGDLKTTSGVPIRGRLVQSEIETIREEDEAGAEYDEERVKNMLKEIGKLKDSNRTLHKQLESSFPGLFEEDKDEADVDSETGVKYDKGEKQPEPKKRFGPEAVVTDELEERQKEVEKREQSGKDSDEEAREEDDNEKMNGENKEGKKQSKAKEAGPETSASKEEEVQNPVQEAVDQEAERAPGSPDEMQQDQQIKSDESHNQGASAAEESTDAASGDAETPEAQKGETPEAQKGETPEAQKGETPEAQKGETPEEQKGDKDSKDHGAE